MRSRRKFTREFKEAAVRRLELGASMAEVARACEVSPNVLHRWRRELREQGGKAFPGEGQRRLEVKTPVADLERKIGRQALEIDFLQRCLQHVEEQRRLQALTSPQLACPYIEKEVTMATPIPLGRLCCMAGVSRAGFYRWQKAEVKPDADLALRDAMQRVALEWPAYGWRRMTAELRRRGWTVNHKRVRQLMRADNLLCLRRRKFQVATTDSTHARPVYPNLTGEMTVTEINQLWVADITYIRLETEFVYLAVVLDACSRRVIGWALDRTLEDELAQAALAMALDRPHGSAWLGAPLRPRRAVRLARLHRVAAGARHRHQHEPQRKPL